MYSIFPPDFLSSSETLSKMLIFFQAPTRFPTCFRRSVGGIAVLMQINIIYVSLKDPVLTLEEPLVLSPSYNSNLIRYISHRCGIFMKSVTAQVFHETFFFHDIRFHLCLSVMGRPKLKMTLTLNLHPDMPARGGSNLYSSEVILNISSLILDDTSWHFVSVR